MTGIPFKLAAARTATVVLVAMLSGCAVPTTSEGIVVQDLVVQKMHPHSVSVKVTGGSQSGETKPAQISNTVLTRAIVDTITKSRVFASVRERNVADYELNVMIFQLGQPSIGFNMTVFLEIGWTLSHRPSGRVIWQESIKTSNSGSVGTAFVAAERLRITTERAARESVEQAIQKISRLQLQ